MDYCTPRDEQTGDAVELDRKEQKMRRVFYGAAFLHLLVVALLYLVRPKLMHVFAFFQGIMLWNLVVIVYAFQGQYSISAHIEEVLQHRSFEDHLTSTYNYRFIHLRLSEEHERSRRYGESTSVLLLDLDGFKSVNDRFSHRAGDYVLKGIARVLKQSIRASDSLGRMGGDEFLVVLPQSGPDEGRVVGERLRRAVEGYALEPKEEGVGSGVTVSVGVAAYPQNGETMDDVLTAADKAVYSAKEQGGNRVCVAEESVSNGGERLRRRQRTVAALCEGPAGSQNARKRADRRPSSTSIH